jgi:hypothetical protein
MNVNYSGNNRIKDNFSTIILGDFLSYFLAKFYKKDPEKVETIEKIKDLIKNEKI